MSNHDSLPAHTDRPADQHPAQQPPSSTDRPTATYPTGYPHQLPEGWRADPRPGRYLDPTDPRLVQADATPTGVFPARRSIRPLGQPARPARPEQAADAASTARTRPGTHACHAPAAPSTEPEQAATPRPRHEEETPIQDMGRPGILARPSMAWHPSLTQLAIGAALVAAIIGACNVAAIQAHREARAYCHELVVSDWTRAERECRGTGESTPVPGVPSQPARPEQPPAPAHQAPTSKPAWTVHGTGAAYDRTDPHASPLDLPRCTTAPDTPMPCLAHVSADSRHVTVLEEDASLTGLDRR